LPVLVEAKAKGKKKSPAAPEAALVRPGDILHSLKGKPAAVVNKLRGSSELAPTPAHCAALGDMLARMHLAGQDFGMRQPNLRGLAWWNETIPVVLPHVTPAQKTLLLSELAYQNHMAASSAYRSLPRGPVHADLFRDNVMFELDASTQPPSHTTTLTGLFDFYFAGCDTWLFDIGVCLNDWCVNLADGSLDTARADALVGAYQAVRRLTAQERQLLPAMQRAGALRFWTSRLWDYHLPREAAVLKPHDPSHFERVLRERLAHPYALA
jgi:homoserine kinase type II